MYICVCDSHLCRHSSSPFPPLPHHGSQLLSSASLTVRHSCRTEFRKWFVGRGVWHFQAGPVNTFLILFLTCPPMERRLGDANPGIYTPMLEYITSALGKWGLIIRATTLTNTFLKELVKSLKTIKEVIKCLEESKL